jgi:solute carrier family 25, member 39/40
MASFVQSAQTPDGQNHDRPEHHHHSAFPTVLPVGSDSSDEPVEITTLQKMLSATSGSLLTGLLGAFDYPDSCAQRR